MDAKTEETTELAKDSQSQPPLTSSEENEKEKENEKKEEEENPIFFTLNDHVSAIGAISSCNDPQLLFEACKELYGVQTMTEILTKIISDRFFFHTR